MKRGVYVGRFQPFHNGHLQDVINALKEVDELAIGLGSAQENNTKKNPFTQNERMEMISLTLKKLGIENYVLFTIPDYHDDDKWMDHIKDVTVPFEIAFIGENEWTERCFNTKGYQVHKLPFLEGLSATLVRERINNDDNWEELVPEEVASYIKYIKGEERIKNLQNEKSK